MARRLRASAPAPGDGGREYTALAMRLDVPASFAGIDAEDGVSRAPANRTGEKRYKPHEPQPPRISFQDEKKAQKPEPYHHAYDPIDISNILLHS